jgi:hypothetical protein
MRDNPPTVLSPFAECVVLAALYGRCMTHRRASVQGPGTGPYDFWMQQERLASAVERRIQILTPCSAVDDSPMLLFAHMLAHGAVILLSKTAEQAPSQTLEQEILIAAYQRRASVAAWEIVRLAKAVPSLSAFRMHPFLPDPLVSAAAFLSTKSSALVGGKNGVQQVLRVLDDAQVINSLAREAVRVLKSDGQGIHDAESTE